MTLTVHWRYSGWWHDVADHGWDLVPTGLPRLGLCLVLALTLLACARQKPVGGVPTRPMTTLGFDYAPETLEVWRVRPGSAAVQADAQATVHVGDRLVAVEGLTVRRAGDEERVLQGK